MVVHVYTDGACKGNPGPGGWGALLRYNTYEKTIYGGELATTNNRMELTAAIKALEALKGTCQVHLFTDSQYLRQGMTTWLAQWKRRGWVAAGGRTPIKNIDLWQSLDQQAKRHSISWHWVKGHNNHPENDFADMLANKAIVELLETQS